LESEETKSGSRVIVSNVEWCVQRVYDIRVAVKGKVLQVWRRYFQLAGYANSMGSWLQGKN